jgi:cytochrome c-type biogenesis protein CcmH/NrfG
MAAHLGLAREYLAAGDPDAAERAYKRAIEARPDRPEPYLELAESYHQRGRPDDAGVILRLALIRTPRNVRARIMLASLEERVFRNPAEALRLCREALAIQPGLAEAQACVRRSEGK